MSKEFQKKLEKWKKEVATTCHNYAKEIDVDFYPFQSSVKERPELLIVSINPGGDGKYGNKQRTANELCNCGENGENAYIAFENDPAWKVNRPILDMFSSEKLREILKQAVVMNTVYFNTKDSKELETPKFEEPKEFCIKKTKELIFDIVKPKNVLVVGFKAGDLLNLGMSAKEDSILRTEDNKSALIMKKEINGIPFYEIHHSSQNYQFNSGENLEKKKAKFEEIFS